MTAWIALGWAATAGPFIGLSAALAWMRLRTHRETDTEALNPSGFSLERYQPMERLLSEDEFLFLTRMPGYKPEVGTKWKRERRRLFRLYLNELGCDFENLHRDVRSLIASPDAPVASSDLVGLLIKQKFVFWRAMAAIDMRLTLDAMGMGAVDARPLLRLVEAMRSELQIVTQPHASGAMA